MADLGKAYVQIVASAEGIAGSVQGVLDPEVNRAGNSASKTLGAAMESAGKKMTKTGAIMSAAVTTPLVALGTKGVQSFADVDKTMQLTNKTMGSTSEQADLLMSAMRDAAAKSVFGMTDAANASLNFARAGLTAEEAAAALAPAMNLAAGEGGNLDTVSAGLVGTINGFGGTFDQASDYADVFANACNNSALDIDSLSQSMSIAAPIFSAAGYNVNDAALYMGTMANAGIDANVAANSLKTGLARLVSPAKEGSEMMKRLGFSVTDADGNMKDSITIQKELHDKFSDLSEAEQVAAASAIFGKNQMSNWLALINTAPEDVQELSDALEQQDTTAEMAAAMMSGFGGSLEFLKSSIDVATTSLGEAFAPIISEVADKVQQAVTWFNSLDSSQQQMIAKIGLVVAAAGPALVVGGKIVSTAGKIVGGIGSITSKFSGIGSAASSAAGPVASAAGSFGTFAGQALKMVAAAAALYIAAQAVNVLVDAAIRISGEGPVAIGVLAGMAVGIGALMAVAAACGPALTAGAVGIGVFGASMLAIGGGIDLACTGIAKVTDAVSGLVDTVSSNSKEINSMVSNVGSTVDSTITTVSNGITNIINAISGGLSSVLDSVSGVISSFGDAALDAGTGFEKLAGAISSLVNGTGVLDLGATLVAVAAGVSKINSAASDAGGSAEGINSVTASLRNLSTAGTSSARAMAAFSATARSSLSLVSSSFAGLNLAGSMRSAINGAISAASSGIATLRWMFASTSFSFYQHIAVPHFSMSGNFDAKSKSVPTVSTVWYARAAEYGAMFSTPQIIGVGDAAQPEILLGEKKLKELTGGGNKGVVNYITVNGAEDPEAWASKFARRIKMEMRTA